MAETLSVTDMLPNKFEPKRSYRWVLACEGIDAFLISETSRPMSCSSSVALIGITVLIANVVK